MGDMLDVFDYGYAYGAAELMAVFGVVALVLAIVGTVLSFIFITPEKKRAGLPKFFQVVHDVFNFNGLIIEKILKALYIFYTLFMILYAFFMIFTGVNLLACLLVMVLGPVLIRVVFEFLMMIILLVKNVIAINKKLKNQNEHEEADRSFEFDYSALKPEAPAAPVAPEAPAAAACPQCGQAVAPEAAFCPHCGTPIAR